MSLRGIVCASVVGIVALALSASISTFGQTKSGPVDPGVRGGAPGAGGPLPGLTADETAFFQDGLARFAEIEVVTNGTIMASGLASTRTSACLATRIRERGERVRRKIR